MRQGSGLNFNKKKLSVTHLDEIHLCDGCLQGHSKSPMVTILQSQLHSVHGCNASGDLSFRPLPSTSEGMTTIQLAAKCAGTHFYTLDRK